MIELQPPDWWEEVPALDGPTITLREVALQDVRPLHELLTDPKVTEYISPPPPSPQAFEGFILWAQRQRQAGSCVCFSVVPRGLDHAIGLFQLRALESSFKIAEWGFAIGSSFWSTGIFEEAATLAAEFAFKTVGVHRLEARAVVENSRGNRALEKIGATGEAVLRNSFQRTRTQFLWSIVAEEWRRPKPPAPSPFDAMRIRREVARRIASHAQAVTDSRDRNAASPYPFFLTNWPPPEDK